MKNKIKYLVTFIVIFFFVTSCEEDLTVYTPDSSWAQLSSSTASSIGESSSTGKTIKVQLGTVSNEDGQSFEFTVTGDSSRFSVSPSDGKIVFGPKAYEATITITPIDNNISDGNAEITLTLVGDNVGTGGDGVDLTSVKLTIVDDDCPIVIDETETWIAQYDYTSSSRGLMPSNEIELEKLSENEWYLPTTWGLNGVSWLTGNSAYDGLYVFDAVITLNTADFTCTIDGLSSLTPGGDAGTYDPCTNTFTFPTLTDALFGGGAGLNRGFTLKGK